MKKMFGNNKGFTLVEMAIVLVIIGLLLGGVLKGQELIENGRVKRAVSELNSVSVAYNGYIDRFNRIPGDDGPTATLTARGAAWTNVVGGDNDGVLEITAAQTFTGAGENDNFWQQVRAAGFITGDAAVAAALAVPRNSFGGLMGLTTGVTATTPVRSACISQVPGKAAMQMDVQLDDGVPNTGTIRVTQGVAGANTVPAGAAATYSEDNQYTLCRAL